MTKKEETYSYKGWLNSDSFIKRVFAIMGYGVMGQIFTMLIILGLAIILSGIGVVFGS